jgi:predicted ATPase
MRFGISNYLSIRDYQEVTFVASSLKDTGTDLLEISGLRERLLPALLIYGANASGKSNVLAGLRFLRNAVLSSHNQASPTGGVPRRPFRLDPGCETETSQVDCDFIVNNVRYHYGFQTNGSAFTEEWLYAFPQGNRQAWFTRSQGKVFKFGKYLRGQNKVIAELTRPNSLFLSAAAQNSHDQLSPLYNFFSTIVSIKAGQEGKSNSDEVLDKRTLSFLRAADTGITSYRLDKKERTPESKQFMEKFAVLLNEQFPDVPLDPKSTFFTETATLMLGHSSGQGEEVFFDLKNESRGTLRLLALLKPVYKRLDGGGTIMIDEIDTSLHTLIARDIVKLFTSSKTNTAGAQLLATTHDTSLLCSTDIRRDQVWFTEKDSTGATHVYPLTDIQTRKTDNLEKGYIQGRFGGIPFFGDSHSLIGRKRAANAAPTESSSGETYPRKGAHCAPNRGCNFLRRGANRT